METRLYAMHQFNMTGNLTGNLTGSLTGSLTGNMSGNMVGNSTGISFDANGMQQNIPAWAKAEQMEQSESLEHLWQVSENTAHKNRFHLIRRRLAEGLIFLANRLCDDIYELKSCPREMAQDLSR